LNESTRRTTEIERLNDIAPVGLCYFDREFRFRYINKWLARINGLPVDKHLGKPIDELLQDVADGIKPQLRHVVRSAEPIIDGEVEAETPAHPGEKRHFQHSYYPDKNDDGEVEGICCVIRDVTEKKLTERALAKRSHQLQTSNGRLAKALSALKSTNEALKAEAVKTDRANAQLRTAKKQLQQLALYDTLTGLGNRNLFTKQLERFIAIAEQDNREIALLEMDLDGFKEVNDRLGHAAGDDVLREFGTRLRNVLSKADRQFRIGGDEFAVLLAPRFGAFDNAAVLAEKIAESAASPMEIKGHSCSIGVSIGIAVFPDHGREPNALLRKADAAMYEAKKKHLVMAGASDMGATTVLSKLQMQA